MSPSRAAKLAAVGIFAAAGTGAGLAAATAAETTPSPSTSSSTTTPGQGSTDTDRPGHRHGHGGLKGVDAAALAAKLGLDEANVAAAAEKVRDALRAERESDDADTTPPTEEERAAKAKEFAAALATELGIEESAVTTALEDLRAERIAAGKAAFTERVDAAIAAGTLTEADKASVLKAYDAGLFGGRGGRH